MTQDETPEAPARQPAPTPTHLHVPPGSWVLVVQEGEGPALTQISVEGPAQLRIQLAEPS